MNNTEDICNEIDLRLSVHSALMGSGWVTMETAATSLLNSNQSDISNLKNLQFEQETSAVSLTQKIYGILPGNGSDVTATVLSNGFEMKSHQNLSKQLRDATETINAEADRLENEYFTLQEQISALKKRLVEKKCRQIEQQKKEEERKKKEEKERKEKEEKERKEKEEEERKKEEEERKEKEKERKKEEEERKEKEEKERKEKEKERKKEEKERKEKEKERKKEEEERKKKTKKEEERKKKFVDDKSAKRKSVLNMREEDRFKAEQVEKDSERQKARATGKQMAELCEQMRQGSRKLQIEFRDVSQGLKSATDEAKLKTKGEQHRTVIDKVSSIFGKAKQEKRRHHELQESVIQMKKLREESPKTHNKTMDTDYDASFWSDSDE